MTLDSTVSTPAGKYSKFYNGQLTDHVRWLDTDGNLINAHDGGILFADGRYYWYGMAVRPLSTREGGQITTVGVVLYSSTDLYNWDYEGVILECSTDPNHPLCGPMRFERPKIVYNDRTKQFVMWFHYVEKPGHYLEHIGGGEAGIASCGTINGKYTSHGFTRPIDERGVVRDCTLYKDDDGSAYFIYDRDTGGPGPDFKRTLHVVKLTDDYLAPTSTYSCLGDVGDRREAPVMIKRDGYYFLVTSGLTSWRFNPAKYCRATNILGPYTDMGDPCVGSLTETTFNSQGTHAFPVEGKSGAFILICERHNTACMTDSSFIFLPVEFPSPDTLRLRYISGWNLENWPDAAKTDQQGHGVLRPATIPTKDQVGAKNLPDEIAPVTAPFPMPAFNKPTFPALTVDITAHGAKAGVMARTEIQAAIDEVNRRGGGTVVVPKGKWLTGRLDLKSNVNLRVDDGAELVFSGEVADYRPAVFTRVEGVEVMSLGACIYANGQDNIAVTGRGTLVGPAKDGSVRRQTMNATAIENYFDHTKPVADRVYEGHDGSEVFPPMFISPINCTNVYVEGVTLENTAFWNIVPVYCDGVIIRGVTVNSVGIPRGDGIDVESSRNVLIEYCTLNCGDDCFTIKAGRGEDGLRVNRATENVVIRYCLAQEGHGGVTVGSETAGMIRNLYVHDTVFDNTGVGLRFKTRRPRGGGGENLTFERIRMNLTQGAFDWEMLGSRKWVGELADRLPAREVNRLTPIYRNIVARDIVVENASMFFRVIGIPESPLTDVLIENVDVNAKELFRATDVKGITVRDATIRTDTSIITLVDARDVVFENVHWTVPGDALEANVSGDQSAYIRFAHCVPEKPTNWQSSAWPATAPTSTLNRQRPRT